eukprot:15362539-Ditylum_brightwellii.AAC.2
MACAKFSLILLLGLVLQGEREKSAAKGKAYASCPATFKESLSFQQNPSLEDTHNALRSSHHHDKTWSHPDNKPTYDSCDAATTPSTAVPRQN